MVSQCIHRKIAGLTWANVRKICNELLIWCLFPCKFYCKISPKDLHHVLSIRKTEKIILSRLLSYDIELKKIRFEPKFSLLLVYMLETIKIPHCYTWIEYYTNSLRPYTWIEYKNCIFILATLMKNHCKPHFCNIY